MDFVLVSITALSLILALAMGVVLFTVLREDRQRSDARVAALASASAKFDLPLLRRDAEGLGERDGIVRTSNELFAVSTEPSPWVRRLGVAVALAVVIGGVAYVVLPARSANSSPASAAAPQNPPLELLTLNHTQQPSGLTISGTVYNPRTGAPVSQVFAAVVLFGPDGSFLTSARAPLDFTTLRPGEESPFIITIPVAGVVARYRVGFRGADGSVIAHVDRRADATAAQNAPSGGTPWAH
jgi:hypothetical protein